MIMSGQYCTVISFILTTWICTVCSCVSLYLQSHILTFVSGLIFISLSFFIYVFMIPVCSQLQNLYYCTLQVRWLQNISYLIMQVSYWLRSFTSRFLHFIFFCTSFRCTWLLKTQDKFYLKNDDRNNFDSKQTAECLGLRLLTRHHLYLGTEGEELPKKGLGCSLDISNHYQFIRQSILPVSPLQQNEKKSVGCKVNSHYMHNQMVYCAKEKSTDQGQIIVTKSQSETLVIVTAQSKVHVALNQSITC